MKRSALRPSTTPMKRTAFARGERIEAGEVSKLLRAVPMRKSMKSSGPRMTPIRRAARGQDCTLRLPGICNHACDTTVLCHSNYLKDGKGMGLKAPDTAAAFGCSCCHDVLDGRRQRPTGVTAADVEAAFYAGVARTHQILKKLGLLPVAAGQQPTTEQP